MYYISDFSRLSNYIKKKVFLLDIIRRSKTGADKELSNSFSFLLKK